MYRIFVLGGPGSGKTTLATSLSAVLGTVHYKLDDIVYGHGNGAPASRRSLAAFAEQLAGEDSWVLDGNYVDWVGPLMARADVILLMDVPWPTAMWRVLKRELKARLDGHLRPRFWPFLHTCRHYYLDQRSLLIDPLGVPATRPASLSALAPFAHKVRRCRNVDAALVHVGVPSAAAVTARRGRLSMLDDALAFVREHGRDHDLWFWYDAAERYRGIYLAVASAHFWEHRLISMDFPGLTDVATGGRRPIPVGRRIALMTARERPLAAADDGLAALGLRLDRVATRTIQYESDAFELAIVIPVQSDDAVVTVLPLRHMRSQDGAVRHRHSGVDVVTSPRPWHYAAELYVPSDIRNAFSNRTGYLRLRGAVSGGPVGIGVLDHGLAGFVSREALPASPKEIDVYLPIARLGDAAAVIVQTWDRPRAGTLSIRSMEFVCAK